MEKSPVTNKRNRRTRQKQVTETPMIAVVDTPLRITRSMNKHDASPTLEISVSPLAKRSRRLKVSKTSRRVGKKNAINLVEEETIMKPLAIAVPENDSLLAVIPEEEGSTVSSVMPTDASDAGKQKIKKLVTSSTMKTKSRLKNVTAKVDSFWKKPLSNDNVQSKPIVRKRSSRTTKPSQKKNIAQPSRKLESVVKNTKRVCQAETKKAAAVSATSNTATIKKQINRVNAKPVSPIKKATKNATKQTALPKVKDYEISKNAVTKKLDNSSTKAIVQKKKLNTDEKSIKEASTPIADVDAVKSVPIKEMATIVSSNKGSDVLAAESNTSVTLGKQFVTETISNILVNRTPTTSMASKSFLQRGNLFTKFKPLAKIDALGKLDSVEGSEPKATDLPKDGAFTEQLNKFRLSGNLNARNSDKRELDDCNETLDRKKQKVDKENKILLNSSSRSSQNNSSVASVRERLQAMLSKQKMSITSSIQAPSVACNEPDSQTFNKLSNSSSQTVHSTSFESTESIFSSQYSNKKSDMKMKSISEEYEDETVDLSEKNDGARKSSLPSRYVPTPLPVKKIDAIQTNGIAKIGHPVRRSSQKRPERHDTTELIDAFLQEILHEQDEILDELKANYQFQNGSKFAVSSARPSLSHAQKANNDDDDDDTGEFVDAPEYPVPTDHYVRKVKFSPDSNGCRWMKNRLLSNNRSSHRRYH